MRQHGANALFQIGRVFDTHALDADRLSHGGEVRVVEVCAGVQVAGRLHLHRHEAERAVVDQDDLDGQFQLLERQDVPHQHRETTVARQRNDLAPWASRLRAEGLRHGIGHRAVVERADQAPLTIHAKVARCPHGGRAHVGREDGIGVGQLAHQPGEVLRMDEPVARAGVGQLIQFGAGVRVMGLGALDEAAIGAPLKPWQQCANGRLHIAHQAHIDRRALAYRFGADVDLHHLGFGGVEIAVRKVGAQHHQRVGIAHRVVARREADQPRHADVIGVIPLDMLLATQRVHHRRAQGIGQSHHLIMGARAATAAQQRDRLGGIQQLDDAVDIRCRRHHAGR